MTLSVCMPYWIRQAHLDRSLAAYRRIYGHLDVEISICDDGSPEPVRAPGCTVTTLPRKDIGMNPCVPMNAAVRASSHDVIVLTNPEIEHRDDVFGPMLSLLSGPDDYVTARCRDNDGAWLAGPDVDYSASGRLPVPEGANFHFCAMLHRELFERVRGFDESYRFGRACEDNDFLWRLHSVGARFINCDAVVWHYRTPHTYAGTGSSNRERLMTKWGHLWKQ